jgi:hypothetical protein
VAAGVPKGRLLAGFGADARHGVGQRVEVERREVNGTKKTRTPRKPMNLRTPRNVRYHRWFLWFPWYPSSHALLQSHRHPGHPYCNQRA